MVDVKTAFLNGLLHEEIYMKQPLGYESSNKNLVCKLKRSIYGLKQASRSWNECFTIFIKEFNSKQCKIDTCVLISKTKITDDFLIVCIYVDDGLILSNSNSLIDKCIKHLQSKFEITTKNNKKSLKN